MRSELFAPIKKLLSLVLRHQFGGEGHDYITSSFTPVVGRVYYAFQVLADSTAVVYEVNLRTHTVTLSKGDVVYAWKAGMPSITVSSGTVRAYY